MKLASLLIAFILTSCVSSYVAVKHPLPEGKKNLSEIPSKLRGTYQFRDTLLNGGLFTAKNERYNPEIILEEATSLEITIRSSVTVYENMVVRHSQYSFYAHKDYYESEFSRKDLPDVDTVIFVDDIAKIVEKRELDTLMNLDSGDVLRKYKGNLIVNRWIEDAYYPFLVTRDRKRSLSVTALSDTMVTEYYYSFSNEEMDWKVEQKNEDIPIEISNSELKDMISKGCFVPVFTLDRILKKDEE